MSEAPRKRGDEGYEGCDAVVTLRLFATRSLLTASRKMPFRLPASPVFSSARLAVPLLTTAHRFCAVTLRGLRDAVTAHRFAKNAVPPSASPVFSSARFAVPLLPAAQRFLLVSRETFIHGPILLHAHPRCPARPDSAPRRWEGQSLHRRRSGSCPARYRPPTDRRTR